MSQSLKETGTSISPIDSTDASSTTQNIYLYGLPDRTPRDKVDLATEEKQAGGSLLQTPALRTSTMSTASESIPSDNTSLNLPLINQFDSCDEEPFVLETFHDLISQHYLQGKHFIIARVKTRDRVDRNRVYYSFFAAHHLNKVLFRVDTRRACLHRMRASNPSNNLPINGRVSYYVVTTESIEKNMPDGFAGDKRASMISRTNDIALNVVDTIQEQDENMTMETEASPLPLSPPPIAVTRSRSIRGEPSNVLADTPSALWTPPSHVSSPDISSLSACKGVTDDGRLILQEVPLHVGHFVAVYFATDVDFLNSASVRKIFKDNALDASDATLFSFNTDSRQSGRWVPNWNAIQQQNAMTPRRFCSPRQNPNFKWALLLYLIFGFLLIRFVIADQWAYLGAVIGIVTVAVLVIGIAGGCARRQQDRRGQRGWMSRRTRAVNSWLSRIRRRSRSRHGQDLEEDLEAGQRPVQTQIRAQAPAQEDPHQETDQASGMAEGTVERRTGDHAPPPREHDRPRQDTSTFLRFGIQQPGHDPSTYRAMSHIGTVEANALTSGAEAEAEADT